MGIVTVKDLFLWCKEEVGRGNGDRKIYISRDDEGNGFHPLYYGFVTDPEEISSYINGYCMFDSLGDNTENDIAILG